MAVSSMLKRETSSALAVSLHGSTRCLHNKKLLLCLKNTHTVRYRTSHYYNDHTAFFSSDLADFFIQSTGQ
jgi:hypothetical protein